MWCGLTHGSNGAPPAGHHAREPVRCIFYLTDPGGPPLAPAWLERQVPSVQPSPVLDSALTCPNCGLITVERMPTDACLYFYQCAGCQSVLRPKTGDCCVFCSYGSVKCPPVQEARGCCAVSLSADSPSPLEGDAPPVERETSADSHEHPVDHPRSSSR